MLAYESMLVLVPQLEEEQLNTVISRFEEIITSNGGELVKTDRIGKRRLAYEIEDLTEGYYVLLHFNAGSAVVAELERVFKITDSVLRHLLIRKGT